MAATSCLTTEAGGKASFVEEVDSIGMLEQSSFPEGLVSVTWKHDDFSSVREDATISVRGGA
jgi:hypothetical protein